MSFSPPRKSPPACSEIPTCLIADGIESVLDIGGSAVIWGGLKFAARPPDATHPYGHGKAEPLAAGIVAVGVLLAALGLAIQSAREIFLPHHAPAPFTLDRFGRRGGGEGISLSLRDPPRKERGEHGCANRRLASSRGCDDLDRRFHWHFHRPDRRRKLAKCGCLGRAFRLRDHCARTAIGFFSRPCTRCWTPRRAAKS